MSGHTKTVWRAKGDDGKWLSADPWFVEHDDCSSYSWLSVHGPNGEIVIIPTDDGGSTQESEVVALKIVAAMNSHDQLVAALKAAEELYNIGILDAPAELLERVPRLRKAALSLVEQSP